MRKYTKKPVIGKKASKESAKLIARFVDVKKKVHKLPQLSDVERASFDHAVDLEHLYNSSKVEGSILTKEQIREAVHG
ncbi:MAG: hypothetical protein NUV88_00885 [Candidatus Kaiserbacteria bacterium]|nr:hypothetical protein [Candidatus Kaiserbacteria bacterium]